MTWKQNKEEFEYIYEGSFNEQGLFHGKGKLTEPTGVYTGDFIDGQKHGFGVYLYSNSLTYKGHYKNNVREGLGKLINPNNRVAYEGEFHDGLPHGKGKIFDNEGIEHTSFWERGIDKSMI